MKDNKCLLIDMAVPTDNISVKDYNKISKYSDLETEKIE